MDRQAHETAHAGKKPETRTAAEQLFEAFRSLAPFRHRPGFGSISRPGEFQLIHKLSHAPQGAGMRVGDLAIRLGVKPPTISQMVNALVARGLVERYADDSDRRAIRVRLSEKGRELAADFHARAIREIESVVEHLGPEDSARLTELLLKASGFMRTRQGGERDCGGHAPEGKE